jgi:hypothetical protein
VLAGEVDAALEPLDGAVERRLPGLATEHQAGEDGHAGRADAPREAEERGEQRLRLVALGRIGVVHGEPDEVDPRDQEHVGGLKIPFGQLPGHPLAPPLRVLRHVPGLPRGVAPHEGHGDALQVQLGDQVEHELGPQPRPREVRRCQPHAPSFKNRFQRVGRYTSEPGGATTASNDSCAGARD